MKKTLTVCICLSFFFLMTGCSPGELLEEYFLTETSDTQITEPQKRIYIDEISGTLLDFTGSHLSLQKDDTLYFFDVSQASLECKNGMIIGDEISIIYEGQMEKTDTSTVKALKVTDVYHRKTELKERTAHGKIQSLTPNTITIMSKSGKTATYPITGTEQYYKNGVAQNAWVYLHFKGTFQKQENDTSGESSEDVSVLNAEQLKVLTISDTEPFQTPKVSEKNSKLKATIKDLQTNRLLLSVDSSDKLWELDISSIPCYFPGGTAPGSQVTITYKGTFQEETFDGISVLSIRGEDLKMLKEHHISSTVSGEILAWTANTVTLRTTDGAQITCKTSEASNLSSGFFIGHNICITFHPLESKTSNIYHAICIEDAV